MIQVSLQLEERQKSLSAAELEMNALTRWRSGLLINNIFMIIAIKEDFDNTTIITIVTIIIVILITIIPITIVKLITVILGESPAWRRTSTTRSRRWWLPSSLSIMSIVYHYLLLFSAVVIIYQAHARSARARRACALRALGLLLADGAPTVGRGKTF